MSPVRRWARPTVLSATTAAVLLSVVAVAAQNDPPQKGATSFAPVDIKEPFSAIFNRMKRNKPNVMKKHEDYLKSRFDLTKRTTNDVTMSRGKPLPVGPTAKLKGGVTWDELGRMTPEQIRDRDVFPYLPLPHVDHNEGGMVFNDPTIKKLPRLERFDMEFDIPEHFQPEFPPPLFLTTRPDLGDTSKGQLITIDNFYELYNGILNPKQLEGLRLLVTEFPQQQFNATEDRRSEKPSRGVACFDCHANGHSNAAFHLVGDIRPQTHRRRIETNSLRGNNVQRLFGSQRALKTVEDFTEFEQRAAYFDGDPVIATKKGVNPLERGSQVHFMAEMQAIIDFPPAPKLNLFGKLDPKKATPSELRGEQIFANKAQCATCHPAPYYTDNTMHDLKAERFFKPRLEHGMWMTAQGALKTTPLRGIKDSPPYLHDGRLLTLEDTVEFFNLILSTQLTAEEKKDLVAFLRQL